MTAGSMYRRSDHGVVSRREARASRVGDLTVHLTQPVQLLRSLSTGKPLAWPALRICRGRGTQASQTLANDATPIRLPFGPRERGSRREPTPHFTLMLRVRALNSHTVPSHDQSQPQTLLDPQSLVLQVVFSLSRC
jgi:hypothetical protein